jgi:hypothetical protein
MGGHDHSHHGGTAQGQFRQGAIERFHVHEGVQRIDPTNLRRETDQPRDAQTGITTCVRSKNTLKNTAADPYRSAAMAGRQPAHEKARGGWSGLRDAAGDDEAE